LRLGAEVEAAVVVGNRFCGAQRIENQAGERAQIGLNVASGEKEPRSGEWHPWNLERLPRWRA
jgi:hypothetical protein